MTTINKICVLKKLALIHS